MRLNDLVRIERKKDLPGLALTVGLMVLGLVASFMPVILGV